MCGIVLSVGSPNLREFVTKAHHRQLHRGPDSQALVSEQFGNIEVSLAHERLSILDLSNAGSQPMLSSSGKTRIIFNGEIYNYKELAQSYNLEGLKTGTDTEVALELIEKVGIDAACKAFNGMWALAALDRTTGNIYVSRDRFGKKPLYYAKVPQGYIFASEMHSIMEHTSISRNPDPVVASRYLSQSLMNIDERSWIEGIQSFPASSIGVIKSKNIEEGVSDLRTYWSKDDVHNLGFKHDDEYLEYLKATIDNSVKIRLHADVPVGIALSGGLDSSILSSITSEYHKGSVPVRLLSATNPGSSMDESYYGRLMANHLKVDLEEFTLDPGKGQKLYDLIVTCTKFNDGPLVSFSNILFYQLMQYAKQCGLKVILTGQGADEVFCGYRKYPILQIKRLLASGRYLSAFRLLVGSLRSGTVLADIQLSEIKRYLGQTNENILGELTSKAHDPVALSAIGSLEDRQWQDISRYSVPYLCHYEDRMSMAFSREIRSPFLDYRVVELGLSMPASLKLHGGWTKYPLRKAYEKDLPVQIAWRRDKKGFVNPQDDWLRNTLRPWVLDHMLSPGAKVYQTGLVDKDAYIRLLHRYLNGDRRIWFRDVFAPFATEVWLKSIDS